MLDLSTGLALRAARRSYGLTQTQLAKMLDSHASLISQYEGRQYLPSAFQVRVRKAFATLTAPAAVSSLEAARDEFVRAIAHYNQVVHEHLAAAGHRPANGTLDALLFNARDPKED